MTECIRGTTIRVEAGPHGLARMAPGSWLNDEFINFYVEHLNEIAEKSSQDVLFLSSFFVEKHILCDGQIREEQAAIRFDPLKACSDFSSIAIISVIIRSSLDHATAKTKLLGTNYYSLQSWTESLGCRLYPTGGGLCCCVRQLVGTTSQPR